LSYRRRSFAIAGPVAAVTLIGAAVSAQTGRSPSTTAPPIILSPQINVPQAPAPTITVQPAAPVINVEPAKPDSDPTKWLAAIVAVISALISLATLFFGLRQNAAAVARDLQAKRSNAVLQAFENNVARPIGMALDQIERLANDLTTIVPAGAAKTRSAQLEKYIAQLGANFPSLRRLCLEADGALPPVRVRVFVGAHDRAHLIDALGKAGVEKFSAARAVPMTRSAFDEAMETVGKLKLDLRTLLEKERADLIVAVS
jgi:hypothetical protein